MKINNISPDKNSYLQIISSIAKPPKSLYYMGKLPDQRLPTIAVVGTRKPTRYGQEVTNRLTYELAKQGIVIVSGLALGIDALAHSIALDAGGTTIAVLANPLPTIQPTTNRELGVRIIENGGVIISEHGADESYTVGRWSFLERNRIVAGISDAILITEASARSGTLNTAMHALDQGKDVFVVPGNITSPSSEGCNLLLKQGAIPVTSAEDILERLLPKRPRKQKTLPLGSNEYETAVIKHLASGVQDADEIQRLTGIDQTSLNTALTMLELAGTIRPLGNNHWTLS